MYYLISISSSFKIVNIIIIINMRGLSVLTLLVQVFLSVSAFIDTKLIPNTTIYVQQVGFDKEVTKIYRNLRQRRFLACGDGVLSGTDVCDDYNIVSGDGWSSIWQVETGYTWPVVGSPCVEICGDALDLGSYQCDDGNPFSGDGCSSTCQLEPTGFTWVAKPFPTVWTEKCGDGINYGNYQWDDGNTVSGDGCSNTCSVEAGYCCDRESWDDIWGDGLKGSGSQNWDDENVIWGDGWDKHCTAMAGFTWTSTYPTTCTEKCDGLDFYFLPCEDGNSNSGDGWNSCAVETSYQCTEGDPLNTDVCKEICGDGLDYFHYHWDDGNYNSGDGWSVLWLPEVGYLWTGGTNTNADTWPEICGDGLNFGWYEWDDGNLINGDGWDDKWKVETYWTCYWGNPTRKDKWEEKCGDGVDILINAWEDSNVLEWDGCNKYWQIEEGWTWSGGSLTGPDTWVEYFGDGCRVGKEEWDDKNLINGDGCSSLMKIETGYTWSGGNLTTSKDDFWLRSNTTSADYWAWITTARDVWTEIWGDGIDVHVWEWDDGNLRNYDGWDSSCKIEKGWTWTGDTPDIWTMMPRPYVDYLYVSTDNTQLYVVFNEAMILYTGYLSTDFNIYITGDQDYYDFSWSLRNSNTLQITGNKTYIFDLDIKDQMAGYNHEIIHVQFLNDQYFRSESTTLKLLNWTVSTYTNQHASKQDDQCQIKYPLYGFWATFTLVWCIVMFYCYKYMHSMTPLWMIISSFQILTIYWTMDLYIPTWLLNFYIDIEKISFLELPTIRKSLNPVSNDGLSRRFNDYGWDSPAFLANVLSIIFVFYIFDSSYTS